jgi:hypothetical protein
VLGKCSDAQVDHDGDIVSPAAMASEIKRWLDTYPAIRYQHRGDHPAGRGLEAWQDADGATWLKALVVDDAAVKMVKKQVLKAFSVGLSDVQTQKSSRCPRYEIVGFRLTEVSLVDSPSNARCGITVVKSAAGVPEYVGKAWKTPKSVNERIDRCQRKAGKWLAREARLWAERDEVSKAQQALYDDPAAYQAWLAKQATGDGPALDSVAAMFLNSTAPHLRELLSEALSGGYGQQG